MLRHALFAVLVVLAYQQLASASAEEFGELPERPTRPEKFQSPEQVTKYLKQLQAFYGVNGRGRYGKRFTQELAPVQAQQTYYGRILPALQPRTSNGDIAEFLRLLYGSE